MIELWGSLVKSIVEFDVFGCRNELFLVVCVSFVDLKGVCLFIYSVFDYMCDFYVFIVYYIGEVISWKFIFFDDDVVIFKFFFFEVVVDDVFYSCRGFCVFEFDGKFFVFVCFFF